VLHGAALRRFEALRASRLHVSLSHDAGVAAAVVIVERDQ
jgi:phosphopantetheinyl transferase (holo-ACP synthase)